jgi:glycosyltransferase involved in cell wall biosynthesis
MMKPSIEVHCLLHNEAPILPYFIRHYQRFADIYFYESDSTDESPEIARKLSCNIIPLPTNNEANDAIFTAMKNNCWKSSTADWVIVCDTDEFVYHPDLLHVLERTEATIFKPPEWRMFSDKFPTTPGQIYDEVKYGVPGFPGHNKMILFRSSEIREMNYTAGCHDASPSGNVRICTKTDILTLHFHDLGLDYRIKRNEYLGSRLSSINRERGWGIHTTWSRETVTQNFNNDMRSVQRVIQ